MDIDKKRNPFRQRQKGDPISYDGSVEPIPLPFGSQEWPGKLTLTIKASPQDWNTLHLLAQADPEYLGRLIFLHITRPVYEKFLAKEESPLPRGLQNEARQIFMEKARMYVAAAFAVLSHWAHRPLTTWPDYLQAVIREAEIILGKASIWPPGKETVDVIAVVRYLLKMKYGIRANELGLNDIEYMDNEIFRKIYLVNNKKEAAMALLQKYGDSLSIDILYELVPGFGWEYIKD